MAPVTSPGGWALDNNPGIKQRFGLVAVGDDFFVALRVIGGQVVVFLSDLTAALDWPLARQAPPAPRDRPAR